MQPRLDRPDRDAEGRRDLGQRHPQEVVQDDDRATALVQVAKHPVDLVAIGERAGHVRRERRVDGRQLDLDRPPSPAAGLVDAGIDGESIQPGIEPVGIPQLREVPPGSDQPLLDRVACELGVAEDEAGGLVQPHDGGAGELGEGVMIASPRTLHEPSLVHGRLELVRHGQGGRAHRVWRRRRSIGSSGNRATRRRAPDRRCR